MLIIGVGVSEAKVADIGLVYLVPFALYELLNALLNFLRPRLDLNQMRGDCGSFDFLQSSQLEKLGIRRIGVY